MPSSSMETRQLTGLCIVGETEGRAQGPRRYEAQGTCSQDERGRQVSLDLLIMSQLLKCAQTCAEEKGTG